MTPLILLLDLAVAMSAAPSVDARPAEPVIGAFAPLRWSTRLEGLRAAFPGAAVNIMAQRDPERRLASLTRAQTRRLGPVQVIAEADEHGEVHLIRYSSEDRRPECSLEGRAPEDVPAVVDCGWRRGHRALATLRG